jgi:hypothetical protein
MDKQMAQKAAQEVLEALRSTHRVVTPTRPVDESGPRDAVVSRPLPTDVNFAFAQRQSLVRPSGSRGQSSNSSRPSVLAQDTGMVGNEVEHNVRHSILN